MRINALDNSVQYCKPEDSTTLQDLFAAMLLIKSMCDSLNDAKDQDIFVKGLQKFLDSNAVNHMDTVKRS